MVWFRLLAVMAKTVAFTFANLLTLYLLGLAGGTFLGILLVRKSRNPASVFFILQGAITLYAGLAISMLVLSLGRFSLLEGIWSYLNMDESFHFGPALFALVNNPFSLHRFSPDLRNFAANLFVLYFLIPLFMIGPPTLMMGISFPFLQKVVQTDTSVLGRRVGWLQAANILGCTLGTVLTSWLFLRFLGTAGTLKVLILLGAVFFLLGYYARPSYHSVRKASFASALAFLCAIAGMAPGMSLLWSKLHGTTPEKIIVGEDGSGLCLLKSDRHSPERTLLYLDGAHHSWLPYGGIHTLIGALPALLHPNPKEIAVIGLGSGDTAFSIGSREETTEITCFEIIAPQISTLRELDQRKSYAGLRSLLTDRRLNLCITDGRAAIMQANKKYDIIEADALFPYSAYAGNLYSLEYFLLLRSRLKPGGMAVTWAPTKRTERTFVKAFPFVLIFHSAPIFVGSNQPIQFVPSKICAFLDKPFDYPGF
jgi:predicted membrane-bound spermidine synthase